MGITMLGRSGSLTNKSSGGGNKKTGTGSAMMNFKRVLKLKHNLARTPTDLKEANTWNGNSHSFKSLLWTM
jgi:hypothetical protein